MLIALLFAAALLPAEAVSEPTRSGMQDQYRAVMRAWDQDGDKRLSDAEVQRMIDTALRSPAPLAAEHFSEFKQSIRNFYKSQDADEDGFIDLNELLSGPLSTFDCIDTDRNGKSSREEIDDGLLRCPAFFSDI